MSRMQLTGSMTALITPFANGAVDFDALGRLIDFQLANGTQAVIPCGTTGESPTLSHDEHDQVVEFTVRRVNGKIPVIAGTGSNSTSEALRLTDHAKQAGATACLIVNPYYNKPTQQGMFEHVAAIAKIGLPIVLYNIPGRCGVEMTTETIVRLYNEVEQVVALKEATGNVNNASAVAAACDITILSGDDSMTLPYYSVGGKGVISVAANIIPGLVRQLCDHASAGRYADATKLHLHLFPIFKGLFVETNPIPIKAACALAGLCQNELRLPMTPLSESLRPKLVAMLKSYGVKV